MYMYIIYIHIHPSRVEPVMKQLERELATRRRCARPETLPCNPRLSAPQTHERTSGMLHYTSVYTHIYLSIYTFVCMYVYVDIYI